MHLHSLLISHREASLLNLDSTQPQLNVKTSMAPNLRNIFVSFLLVLSGASSSERGFPRVTSRTFGFSSVCGYVFSLFYCGSLLPGAGRISTSPATSPFPPFPYFTLQTRHLPPPPPHTFCSSDFLRLEPASCKYSDKRRSPAGSISTSDWLASPVHFLANPLVFLAVFMARPIRSCPLLPRPVQSCAALILPFPSSPAKK